jgi:hypothetical protein
MPSTNSDGRIMGRINYFGRHINCCETHELNHSRYILKYFLQFSIILDLKNFFELAIQKDRIFPF